VSEQSTHRAVRRVITTTEELRSAVVQVSSVATRSVCILTPDLEPSIYGHERFLDTIKHFVLAGSFSRVRVLISEPTRSVRTGHRFVTLGRRLSSHIEFRNLNRELETPAEAYLLADDVGLVYRADARRPDGLYGTREPSAARRHLGEFEAMWAASAQSAELRALRV